MTPLASGTATWQDLFIVIGVCLIIGLFGATGATWAEWIMGAGIIIAALAWAKSNFANPAATTEFSTW